MGTENWLVDARPGLSDRYFVPTMLHHDCQLDARAEREEESVNTSIFFRSECVLYCRQD